VISTLDEDSGASLEDDSAFSLELDSALAEELETAEPHHRHGKVRIHQNRSSIVGAVAHCTINNL